MRQVTTKGEHRMVKTETEVKKLALALLNDLENKFEGSKHFNLEYEVDHPDVKKYHWGAALAYEEAADFVRKAIRQLQERA
jgi:hypothetical protein